MSGVLALVGGREHTPGCEAIDLAVLATCPAPRPRVAVVPLASSVRTRARTVGRALDWWESLGARATVVPPDLAAGRDVLAAADVVVLPGGVPDRLHRNLVATRLGDQIVRRWRSGAALVGSSSGAMVVAAWRQSVRPPFDVRAGFGLLPHVAVAPHHELRIPRGVATLRARTHPHAIIVGIDEATGLVGRDGVFDVLGVGSVTVRRGAWTRTWTAGSRLDLAALGARAAHGRTSPPAVPVREQVEGRGEVVGTAV